MEILRPNCRRWPGLSKPTARRVIAAMLAGWLLFAGACSALAQGKAAGEYEIKAAFLYNFTKFVEWPQEAFPAAISPIRLCVLGSDPFGPNFETAVAGKRVNGRNVEVAHLMRLEPIRSCQVLFVTASRVKDMPLIVQRLGPANVLTVGDSPGFANLGIVNFIWDGNRVRFEISPVNAQRAGLKISSRLMSLARIVSTPPSS